MDAKQIVERLLAEEDENNLVAAGKLGAEREDRLKQRATMPAGTYYVGDPCYAIETKWQEILRQTDFFKNPVGTINGKKVLAFGTAFGDGEYIDDEGRKYGVDAGLIGLVPVEVAEKTHALKYMHKLNFSIPIVCTNNGGMMRFGDIVIDTIGDNDEDEDTEDEDFDDESEDE